MFRENLKKRVIKNNELKWNDFAINDEDNKIVTNIDLIKVIRNNLFHGHKHSEHIGLARGDSDRDEKLLIYAIEVIQELLELDDKVKSKFYDLPKY